MVYDYFIISSNVGVGQGSRVRGVWGGGEASVEEEGEEEEED